jgi:hypothetical protein
VRTRHLSLVTSTHSVTTTTTSNVLSPYGPVRAGLTTSRTTQEAQLTELLSSLENVVANLNSKSSTLCDTLSTAILGVSAVLSATPTGSAGIDQTCDDCGGDLVAEGESKCLDCLEAML